MKKRSGSPLVIAAALTALPAVIALAQFPQGGGMPGGFGGGMPGGGFGGGFGGFGGGFGGFGGGQGQQQELGDEPALREIFKDDFLCGVALGGFTQPDSFTGKLAGKHFNRVVADNAMKWESVERSEGNFNWGGGDGLVRMAKQYDMQLHGHCFVWYQQTPGWVYRDLQPNEQGRETLIKRMQNHIRTRIAHDKENFHVWDVVNEAVVQDGSMRKSFWYNIVGSDYVKLAFETAREADPTAKLVYN
ncbi:MAG: endo-1,4-beta-xylanase, partial [Lentisphaeria bacterium]|nr:endo-1,4-beta-xylanase [Lentisphaeria bacterium]